MKKAKKTAKKIKDVFARVAGTIVKLRSFKYTDANTKIEKTALAVLVQADELEGVKGKADYVEVTIFNSSDQRILLGYSFTPEKGLVKTERGLQKGDFIEASGIYSQDENIKDGKTYLNHHIAATRRYIKTYEVGFDLDEALDG